MKNKNKTEATGALTYNDKPWFKIDNASNLYAGARTKSWCRTFRVAFVLDREIEPEILQKAVDMAVQRFPFFSVRLRDGFFWSYFERTEERVIAQKETVYPYQPSGLASSKQPCFRVLYFKNRLTFECFHSLTDGNGAFEFLASIASYYFNLCGENIEKGGIVPELSCEAKQAEAQDSYYKHADPSFSAKNPPKPSVYLPENNHLENYFNLTHGICSAESIKEATKKHSLTVTEYLTAVLIFMSYSCADEPIDLPISISVPIDLRRRFPSESIRNFAFMTDISFNPQGRKDITFDEICDAVRGKLSEKSTKEALLPEISANVAASSNKVISIIPYFIKKLFLKNTYKKVQQTYTAFFSNIGVIRLPEELQSHVLRAEFCLGETPYQHFGCAAATVGDVLTFSFSSGNKNTERQKFFFRFLANDGVKLRIESNMVQ